ncbi:MAG: hypothetical protein AB9869_04515 [Verrucomicrobiia bacterium]
MAAAVCCAVCLGVGAGCVTESRNASTGSRGLAQAAVEEINLLAIPVAVNLDQNPGVDGFVIKVYASSRSRPKPMNIGSGVIDVFMFEGILGVTTAQNAAPRQTWQYSAAQMKEFQIESSIGTGYQLALNWGENGPTSSKISVLVRYTPPQGSPVISAPSIISVALK